MNRSEDKVDPAALLVAVFAVAAGPLLTSGPWEWINSVVGATVLAVVWAYAWPERGAYVRSRHVFAAALVMGFLTAVLTAWPIQLLVWGGQPTDGEVLQATIWSLVAGAVVACVLFAAMVRLGERRRPVAEGP